MKAEKEEGRDDEASRSCAEPNENNASANKSAHHCRCYGCFARSHTAYAPHTAYDP